MRYLYSSAALAIAVAVAADRRRLARRLRTAYRDATHDPVTGLPNRRGLAAAGPAALTQATADWNGVLVVLVDLVGFKQVNDRYGHDAGDAVLGAVADRLSTARDVVLAARLGGDEYAALLHTPGTDPAIVLAELHAVLTGPVAWPGGPIPVGATVGGVHADASLPVGEWLARADAAMYRARADRTTTALWRPGRDPVPHPAPLRSALRSRDARRPTRAVARVDLAALQAEAA